MVGRAELVSAVFFFLSFIFYVQTVNRTCLSMKWLNLTLSVVFAGCSMLSKEPGITVLAICVGYDILSHWPSIWRLFKRNDVIQNGYVKSTEKYNGSSLKDKALLSLMSKRIGIS